jgi:5S rRNA maturation endonuclease (ribonuclease M5)
LSTHLRDKIEKIEQIIAKLTEESAKGKPIVVEGKKDTQTLQDLGINSTILMVKTAGKSFLKATQEIEAIGAGEVILLLDFDRRGKEGTKRLQESLERAKIKVDVKFWREFIRLVGREIQSVESLTSYLCTLREKAKL